MKMPDWLHLEDALGVAGFLLLVWGIYLMSPPWAPVVAGVVLMLSAVGLGRAKS